MQTTKNVTLTSLGNNELINAQSQHRAKIMPLMSKKILANMVHMQYHLRKYHDAIIPQAGKPKWNADWIIVLMRNSSSTNYACSAHEDLGQ